MAELADARDLKSLDEYVVRVQIPLPAPSNIAMSPSGKAPDFDSGTRLKS